jgi:hypothetical protein
MLAILIYKAWHKYLHTLQFGTKLDFSSNIWYSYHIKSNILLFNITWMW